MRITKDEKELIKAWARFFRIRETATITKRSDQLTIGNTHIWAPGRFKRIKDGKTYTLKEIID